MLIESTQPKHFGNRWFIVAELDVYRAYQRTWRMDAFSEFRAQYVKPGFEKHFIEVMDHYTYTVSPRHDASGALFRPRLCLDNRPSN